MFNETDPPRTSGDKCVSHITPQLNVVARVALPVGLPTFELPTRIYFYPPAGVTPVSSSKYLSLWNAIIQCRMISLRHGGTEIVQPNRRLFMFFKTHDVAGLRLSFVHLRQDRMYAGKLTTPNWAHKESL